MWNESFEVKIPATIAEGTADFNLRADVYDWDLLKSNDFLGSTQVENLSSLEKGVQVTKELNLRTQGTVTLKLTPVDFGKVIKRVVEDDKPKEIQISLSRVSKPAVTIKIMDSETISKLAEVIEKDIGIPKDLQIIQKKLGHELQCYKTLKVCGVQDGDKLIVTQALQ